MVSVVRADRKVGGRAEALPHIPSQGFFLTPGFAGVAHGVVVSPCSLLVSESIVKRKGSLVNAEGTPSH